MGRLYTSAFWALRDTRTPLGFALVRVVLAAGLGWLLAFHGPKWFGIPASLGLAGLTLAAGLAAWIEFSLLRSSMNRRIGRTGLSASYLAKVSGIAIAAAITAWAVKYWSREAHPLLSGAAVLSAYGAAYMAGALLARIPEVLRLFSAFRSKLNL
jgi:putative peptidoglycan lipid II flippase